MKDHDFDDDAASGPPDDDFVDDGNEESYFGEEYGPDVDLDQMVVLTHTPDRGPIIGTVYSYDSQDRQTLQWDYHEDDLPLNLEGSDPESWSSRKETGPPITEWVSLRELYALAEKALRDFLRQLERDG